MDKIIISDLEIYAYHGVNEEEKRDGQRFIISTELYLSLEKPSRTDCLDDTVSYAKVIKLIKSVFTKAKYDLIEKAAGVVGDAILEEFGAIQSLKILLKKPDAPINADFDYVAVEIFKERK